LIPVEWIDVETLSELKNREKTSTLTN